MSLKITFIGTGRGGDSIYLGSVCSSFILSIDDNPVLLVDAGFRVTQMVMSLFKQIPDNIFISHNHSDHAAELPFILAEETSKGRKINVISTMNTVMDSLIYHRMVEFNSTKYSYHHWANWIGFPENNKMLLFKSTKENIYIELVKSKHSEYCCGFILYSGNNNFNHPILSWSADSGHNKDLYEKLSISPIIILDGRKNGSDEHASFDEILSWYTKIDNNKKPCVIITGYGDYYDKEPLLMNNGLIFAEIGKSYML